MKTREKCKAIEVLNQNESALAKGGEERGCIIVVIDGKEL